MLLGVMLHSSNVTASVGASWACTADGLATRFGMTARPRARASEPAAAISGAGSRIVGLPPTRSCRHPEQRVHYVAMARSDFEETPVETFICPSPGCRFAHVVLHLSHLALRYVAIVGRYERCIIGRSSPGDFKAEEAG